MIGNGSATGPTIFLHERFTPSGGRRLVVMENLSQVYIIELSEAFHDVRRWMRNGTRMDQSTINALADARPLLDLFQIDAGQSDPADPSRFTVPFKIREVTGVLEYRLTDDDLVTVRLLNINEFSARVSAAKARAATRPVTRPQSNP